MRRLLLGCAVLLSVAAIPAHGFNLDGFKDADDGQFDLSEWLLDRKGFLPVPIVITEPAVGFGGGVAIVYFQQSAREAAGSRGPSGEVIPPSLFGAALAATSNGTKLGGLGGMFSFDQDRFRYRGAAAKASLNLEFYGIGNAGLGTSGFGQNLKIAYNLDGWGTRQQLLMRMGSTNVWFSALWQYIDTTNTLNSSIVNLPPFAFAKRSSGAGPTVEYDSRDNIFTPNRGWTGSIDTTFYGSTWGSEDTFQTYRAHVFAYFPLGSALVLGTRLDGRSARGDVPFYLYPSVDLRGIPAGRLQEMRTPGSPRLSCAGT